MTGCLSFNRQLKTISIEHFYLKKIVNIIPPQSCLKWQFYSSQIKRKKKQSVNYPIITYHSEKRCSTVSRDINFCLKMRCHTYFKEHETWHWFLSTGRLLQLAIDTINNLLRICDIEPRYTWPVTCYNMFLLSRLWTFGQFKLFPKLSYFRLKKNIRIVTESFHLTVHYYVTL